MEILGIWFWFTMGIVVVGFSALLFQSIGDKGNFGEEEEQESN